MLRPKTGLYNIEHSYPAYTSQKRNPRMMPQEDVAQIKDKIAELEQSRQRCSDSRIIELIESWIAEAESRHRAWKHAAATDAMF
jgi:hypothetical protein